MADESLNDSGGDWQDMLVGAATDYILEHGIPDSAAAWEWLQNPDFETILGEYFNQGGFSVGEWERMITNIENVSISDWAGGIWVQFDMDFESDDGKYEGSRGVRGGL